MLGASQRFRCAVVALFIICASAGSSGYSVLTHEQVVDLVWKDQLKPLLLKRFPKATPDDLKHAHAFAYGGSLLQDMGYYPFGSKYFSDLVHYVRSGDFVAALLEQSSDLDEYAFALGALAHYVSDRTGHPTINQVAAIEFPRLRRKYGPEVTYGDDPKAHIRTEFGFDMVQVAKNHYTSDRFHDFIGFEFAKPLVERAFLQTYGLKLQDVIVNEDLAIGSFRRAVSSVIPEMTRVALLSRRKEIVRDTPNFNQKEFLFHLSRAQYEKKWGKGYRKPGIGARILAFFLKIVPKVGPFKAVDFKIPTTQTEDMYIKSVNATVDDYEEMLRQQGRTKLELANLDLDTGQATRAGEYSLADETYARLLHDLAQHDLTQIPPAVRANVRADILNFYSGMNQPLAARKDKKSWRTTQADLEKLRESDTATRKAPALRPAAIP